MRSIALAAAALQAATTALAHDGHGLTGGHWHATDAVGLLLVGGIAVAVWYFTRGK